MIEFQNVSKEYDTNTHALNGLTLSVDEGEFVFIVGSSGAGKSTLLKLIMNEEVPTKGRVIVDGQVVNDLKRSEVPYFRRKMGIVFQDFRLIDKMSVFDNVAFAMRVIGAQPKDVHKRVSYILDLVGLSHKAQSRPSEISGGEQQRVSLARALVNNPKIIIADEPTGNIDPKMSYEIMDLLSQINKTGTTVIVVTHEKSLVQEFDRRVIKLEKGRVISDTGNPQAGEVSDTTDLKPANAENITDSSDYEDTTQPVVGMEDEAVTEQQPCAEAEQVVQQSELDLRFGDTEPDINKYDDLIRELTQEKPDKIQQ